VAGALAGLAGGIFGVFTILILTFYILVDSENLRDAALRLFPKSRRTRVAAASREVTVKVSAWLGGQLLVAAVIGSSSAIGLWAMGIPFFYVLAVICAIGELIPSSARSSRLFRHWPSRRRCRRRKWSWC